MSTKLIVFGALFAREILRVDSPVSNIIYVPHVRPPRLPWRKCRDTFVGQHMTQHKKNGHSATPALLFLTRERRVSVEGSQGGARKSADGHLYDTKARRIN